jgi:hypothetical protein
MWNGSMGQHEERKLLAVYRKTKQQVKSSVKTSKPKDLKQHYRYFKVVRSVHL